MYNLCVYVVVLKLIIKINIGNCIYLGIFKYVYEYGERYEKTNGKSSI